MKYLLDTHIFLWFLESSANLPLQIKNEIVNPKNKCYVSIVSFWEIAIKLRLKKLNLKFPFDRLSDYLIETDIEFFPLTFEHLLEVIRIDPIHKDPFDHILIAQGIAEDMTILTKDGNFGYYNAKTFWV